jgi:hypothetical protein
MLIYIVLVFRAAPKCEKGGCGFDYAGNPLLESRNKRNAQVKRSFSIAHFRRAFVKTQSWKDLDRYRPGRRLEDDPGAIQGHASGV